MISFTIPGNPIALKRHRTALMGTKTIAYDSQKKQKFVIKKIIKEKCPQHMLDFKYIRMHITFYFRRPSAVKKTEVLHNRIPDLSNLIKFYEDCMSSVIIKDDRFIVAISSAKFYDDMPRTEIELYPL